MKHPAKNLVGHFAAADIGDESYTTGADSADDSGASSPAYCTHPAMWSSTNVN